MCNPESIIWNGEIVTRSSKVDVPKEEIKDITVWLGGALFFDELNNRRFEGMNDNKCQFLDYTHYYQ